MVFSFGQAGQVIKASSRAALAAQAAPRGAGSVAALPRPTAAPAVYFYRNYERRCGMMVPTELEAAWCSGAQPGGGETSFAHFNLEALAAWDTLEMPPP